MSSENPTMDEITEARRQAVIETIRPISVEELKALGEELFKNPDHPWRKSYFTFLDENAGATFLHATTHDNLGILYCPEKEKGIWFLPGSGKGPLQEKGLTIMKEIVEGMR